MLINNPIQKTYYRMNMQIIFELNSTAGLKIEKKKLVMAKTNFPIKVKLVDSKGREKERLIFIRDKHEIPRIQLS